MRLSQSVAHKLVVTTVTAVGIIVVYEATIFDSKYATQQVLDREREIEKASAATQADPLKIGAAPQPTDQPKAAATAGTTSPANSMQFTASAYCQGTTTASGVIPRAGVAAADERLLPVGSVVQIRAIDRHYSGIYTVMDTGPLIQGPRIDIYMWSCTEALQFGRRLVQVAVLRLGWDPQTTYPNLVDMLFGWREKAGRKEQIRSR
jgi:3D (Asp-Asp-Asp) domain-containing protein